MTEENIKRDFKGIWIPKEIWLDTSLDYFDKVLFAEIHSLDGPEGCWASNDYFCKFFNVNERALQRGLKSLRERGYINIESFNGRQRVLRSNLKTIYDNFDTSAPQKTFDVKKSSNSTKTIDPNSVTSEVTNLSPLPRQNCRPSPSRVTIYDNKEDNKETILSEVTKPPASQATSLASPDSVELVSFFIEEVRKHKPDFQPKAQQSWLKDMDAILRIDKRKPDRVKQVIAWAQDSLFWRGNILSPSKLRKQFEQLEVKLDAENAAKGLESAKKPHSGAYTPTPSLDLDEIEANKQSFRAWVQSQRPSLYYLTDNAVIASIGKHRIPFDDPNFKAKWAAAWQEVKNAKE